MISRLVAVVAGVWLMFAPAVLDYGGRAADNDRIFGPIAASFAFVAMWPLLRPLRWVTLPIGVWLMMSPVVLQYGMSPALVSSELAGLAIVGAVPFGRADPSVFDGGWVTISPGHGRWRAGTGVDSADAGPTF